MGGGGGGGGGNVFFLAVGRVSAIFQSVAGGLVTFKLVLSFVFLFFFYKK